MMRAEAHAVAHAEVHPESHAIGRTALGAARAPQAIVQRTMPPMRRMPLGRPLSVMAVLALCAACAPGPSAAPAPAPVPTPVVTPPSVESPRAPRFRLPLALATTSYGMQVRTELERDSAGRTERDLVESSARVELTLRRDPRGLLRGAGRVDSFVVRASGASARTTTPATMLSTAVPAPLFTSVAIDAVLDSTQLRTVVRPPLANECDRPEAAAAGMARELLVRIPESVSVGDRWRDSLVTLVCRGGVPMTVRTIIESVAAGTTDGDRILRVRRTVATTLDGNSRTPWRQVEITGTGRGTQDVQVDVARGTMVALDGESTLTIRVVNGSLRDAARTQQVVQKVTLSARASRQP